MSAPRGCVFVEGYWDYPLDERGVLFSPIQAPPSAYSQPGFVYTPSMVVDLSLLFNQLFCAPSCDSYFFGDYYDASWARLGFFPWYACQDHFGWYDPIFCHEWWRHRDQADWNRNIQRDYTYRRDHADARPAAHLLRPPAPDRPHAQGPAGRLRRDPDV